MNSNKVNTIDEYIAIFSPEVRRILENVRQLVRKAAPEAAESISYGMPAFKLNGRPLVYFAAFKHHIGFYPLPSVINIFKPELAKFKHSKGSIQFPLNEPMPFELIEKIVKFRIRENAEKARYNISKIRINK